MKEFEIKSEKFSLSKMITMQKEMKTRIEKNPNDKDAVRMLHSLTDEIKDKRKELFEKERASLTQQGLI